MTKPARSLAQLENNADAEEDTLDSTDYENDAVAESAKVLSQERAPVEREEEIYTIAAKQRMRERMEADVQAFLKRGGAINQIDPNVMADPPRKPSVAYGSRPI